MAHQTIKLKNSVVKDKQPLATDLVIGEISVNANEESPALYFKDSADNIIKIEPGSGVTPSPTPPSEPAPGDLWYDSANESLNYWDGSQWVELGEAGDSPVKSVNGQTGVVVLTTSDLVNDSGFITLAEVPAAPVQSVNTKTGDVVLDAADVSAIPDGSWGSYPDAGEVQDSDLFLLNRGDTVYSVLGSNVGGGGGSSVVIEKPEITAPPNGAGMGGDQKFTAQTSEVTSNTSTSGYTTAGPIVEMEQVFYGAENTFVALDTGTNLIYTSIDSGATWTSQELGITGSKYAPWDEHYQVFVTPRQQFANNYYIYTSPDGITWQFDNFTPDQSEAGVNEMIVVDGKGRWMLFGDGDYHISDDAGNTWVTKNAPRPQRPYFATYTGGRWIILYSGGDEGATQVYYSEDGNSFNETNLKNTGPSYYAFGYSSALGLWAAGGSAALGIWLSTDGINFTQSPFPTRIETTDGTALESFGIEYICDTGNNLTFYAYSTTNVPDCLVTTDGEHFEYVDFLPQYGSDNQCYGAATGGGYTVVVNNTSNTPLVGRCEAGSAGRIVTELTLQNDKAFNAEDGSDTGEVISSTFLPGQEVVSDADPLTTSQIKSFDAAVYQSSGQPQEVQTGMDLSKYPSMALVGNDQAVGMATADTVTGTKKKLQPYTTTPTMTAEQGILRYTDDGYYVGNDSQLNGAGACVPFIWRVAPKCFDIQTWTGTGSPQEIKHNLKTTPGMIWVKSTNDFGDWIVYLQNDNGQTYWKLNESRGSFASDTVWNSTRPNDDCFYVGTGDTNTPGKKYIAYLWPVDAPGFKCGTYTCPSSVGNVVVDVGFNPDAIFTKQLGADSAGDGVTDWLIVNAPQNSYFLINKQLGRLDLSFVDLPGNNNFQIVGANAIEDSYGTSAYAANKEYFYFAFDSGATAPSPVPGGRVISAIDNKLKLSNTPSLWSNGLKAINTVESSANAPSADELEFVGSIPSDVPQYGVSEWGDACWQLDTSIDFSNPQEQLKSITNASILQTLQPSDRSTIDIQQNTQYYARLRYKATTPEISSPYSDAITFKTAEATDVLVDNVFRSQVYSGQNGGREVANGLDGIANTAFNWIKCINNSGNAYTRANVSAGWTMPNTTNKEEISSIVLPSWTTRGFNTGSTSQVCDAGDIFISWEWIKTPKFFDVVPYDGDIANSQLSHQLEAVPTFAIFKMMSSSDNWCIYHKDLPTDANGTETEGIFLNSGDSAGGYKMLGTHAQQTAEYITFCPGSRLNDSGAYVAYLWGDVEGVSKAGTFECTGPSVVVDVGFEVGWIFFRLYTTTTSNIIMDCNVGFNKNYTPYDDVPWRTESNTGIAITNVTSTNFQLKLPSTGTYIYYAIAKGTPTSYFDARTFESLNEQQVQNRYGVDPKTADISNLPITRLTQDAEGAIETFVCEGDQYRPIADRSGEISDLNAEVDAAKARVAEVEQRMADVLTRLDSLEGE